MRTRLALLAGAVVAAAALSPIAITAAAPPTPTAPTSEHPSLNPKAASEAAREAQRTLAEHAEQPYANEPGGDLVTPTPQPMENSRKRVKTTKCPKEGMCVSASSSVVGTDDPQSAQVSRAMERAGGQACAVRSSTAVRWSAYSRTGGCSVVRLDIDVVYHPTGAVTGQAVLYATMVEQANAGSASLWTTSYIWVASWWGTANPDWIEGYVYPNCGRGRIYCEAQHQDWGSAGTTDAWRGSADLAMTLKKGDEADTHGSGWGFGLSNVEWRNTLWLTADLGTMRCDDKFSKRRPGCVIPTYRPTWGIPSATYPQYAYHVSRAINSGLPGSAAEKSYLKRMASGKKRDKNGRTACPPSLSRPDGMQCDEYPFRSTYNGAYSGSSKAKYRKARSFDGCQMSDPHRTGKHGWSRCFILTGENLGAGSKLGAFYADQRVLNKDKFYVGFA